MSEQTFGEPREEWAIAYPTLIGGKLDRVLPVKDLDEAAREQVAWSERGIETRVLHRVIPAWTDHG